MKRYILIILFLSISTIYSQHILLSELTPEDFSEVDLGIGPNRKYFVYSFIGFGSKTNLLNINNEKILPLKSSLDIKTGTIYRLKINKILGLIYDLTIISSWNKLNLDKDPEIPIASLGLKKAKYIYHQISNALAIQINFKPKRGNQLGKYLDLGVYGSYNFSRRFMYVYEQENSDISKTLKGTMKKLSYLNPFEYGFSLRLGNVKSCIFSRYRLANIFNDNTNFTSLELPRLTIGVEILLYSD